MSKRFIFLISFILVLGLSGVVQAGATPIIVDNNSFEYDCNGVAVTCHVGHDVYPGSMCDGSIAGWRYLKRGGVSSAWVGVDVNCGAEDANCDNCHDWIQYPDGNANLYFQGSASVHQIFDHNLAYGRKYTATVDLLGWDPIVVQFFSPNDFCAPDVNHFLLSETVVTPDIWQNPDSVPPGRYMYDLDVKHTYVVTDEGLVGRKLGIKIGGDYLIGGTDTSYLWADHVRLEWDYASDAYDPDPPDEAEDVNYLGVTLSWLPGLWAVNDVNGHEVYFGTSYAEVNDANTNTAGVYRGSGVGVVSGPDANNRYSYVVPGGDLPLDLGGIYYWRIDEVNDNYVGPVPKPWKGDVWSFTVEGQAKNPKPADGEEDVPFLNLTLEWTAGTGATSHDVYFGSDYDDVNDADSSDPNGPTEVFRSKAQTDPCYPVPESATGLTAGQTYYWRIDERSAGFLLKGKIWSFTIGQFLVVDDFDGYANQNELWAVWDDYWVNYSGAQIYLETDPNIIHDGNSLRFSYDNADTKTGSYMDALDPAELEVGTNWTVGGVKALTLYFLGDPCNTVDAKYKNADRLWVELKEVGTDAGVVKHTDVNDMKEDWWHEWNIALSGFSDAGVNLASLDRVTIGVGGPKGGQSLATKVIDQIWIDDMRLYPPRCLPEFGLSSAADIVGGDCVVDYCDLDVMATDWLKTDGNIITSRQDAQITMAAGDPNWTTGHISGALGFDPNIKVDVSDPILTGSTSLSITAWVYRDGVMDGYEGLVTSREDDGGCTEMTNGVDAAMVGYCWNTMTKTWQWDSGVAIPDANWTFVAISVDPTGCTAYAQPAGGTMSKNRQTIELGPLEEFETRFWIGRGYPEARYWKGGMDDVRIYNWNLDDANMALLADQTGEPSPCPVYHYKFNETSGLVAVDSGCGTEFYAPVQSKANLTDPEPLRQRAVNFRDYEILANDWLKEFLWPPD